MASILYAYVCFIYDLLRHSVFAARSFLTNCFYYFIRSIAEHSIQINPDFLQVRYQFLAEKTLTETETGRRFELGLGESLI